jgi:hypothetical protein
MGGRLATNPRWSCPADDGAEQPPRHLTVHLGTEFLDYRSVEQRTSRRIRSSSALCRLQPRGIKPAGLAPRCRAKYPSSLRRIDQIPVLESGFACYLIPGARNDDSSIISGAWFRARGWWGGRAPNQDSIPTARHRPIGQRLGPLVLVGTVWIYFNRTVQKNQALRPRKPSPQRQQLPHQLCLPLRHFRQIT